VPIAPVLPCVAGLVPALALTPALAVPVAIAATAACAATVVVVAKPFERNDLDLISRLDIPTPLKRLTVRTLELTTR
jgi:hypothetical protein